MRTKRRRPRSSLLLFLFLFVLCAALLFFDDEMHVFSCVEAANEGGEEDILEPEWPFLPNSNKDTRDGESSDLSKETTEKTQQTPNFISAELFRALPAHITRNKVRSSALLETLGKMGKNSANKKNKKKNDNNNNNIRGEGEGEEIEEDEDALRRVDNCREILEREDSFFSDAAARGASGGATKTSGGSGGGEGKTMVKTKRDAIDALIDMVKENPKRKEAWRELGLAMQLGRGSADAALTRALSERRSDDGEEEKDEEKEKKMKEKKKKKKKNGENVTMMMNGNEWKRIDAEKKAVYFLQRAADLGDAEAHFELAFLYSTGLGGVVEKDERLAMTHHYFAARGGDVRSHLALGHRHAKGRFAPKSCQASVLYYHPASLKTVEPVIAPVMGENGQKGFDNFRLSRDMKSPKKLKRQKDVVTYYQYAADLGNSEAQNAVGHAYMVGTKGLDVNYDVAVKYLDLAAAQGNAEAMSSLGHAYANGLGVTQNNETALKWFKEAKKLGSPHASYGLAYMYLSGFGVEKNAQEAVKELLKAAERGSMEAQFHLGALHVRGVAPLARDYTKANTYFGLAAAQGHSLASYNLAMMQLGGLGAPIACAPALDKLKLLAERSSTVINVMENAREHFVRRNYKESLYAYAKASEMGVELAQANAAYILERNFGGVQNHLSKEERKRFSLCFHELAADQGNVLSLLTIGDAHYAGWISSSISSEKDDDSEETLMVTDGDGNVLVPSNANSDSNYEKAAQVYRRAAGLRSAAAMFNLGRMHEVGRGVAKDYHLAKRFYDSTLSAEPDAKFIVKFALWGLRFREWVDEKDWKNKDYRTIVSDIFRELLLLRPGIFNSNIMSVGEDEPKPAKIVISTEKTNPPPSSAASGSATEHIVKETNKVIEWGKKNSDVMLVIALGIFLVITLGVRSILAARHHHHRD